MKYFIINETMNEHKWKVGKASEFVLLSFTENFPLFMVVIITYGKWKKILIKIFFILLLLFSLLSVEIIKRNYLLRSPLTIFTKFLAYIFILRQNFFIIYLPQLIINKNGCFGLERSEERSTKRFSMNFISLFVTGLLLPER